MVVRDFVLFFEKLYPARLAQDWDNVGLMVGNENKKVDKILTCLDVTLDVLDEAKKGRVDLIVSHHPFIFKGMKKITDSDVNGRALIEAIKNDISVISLHTNLDMAKNGVNDTLAKNIGLLNVDNMGKENFEKVYKISVFVPKDNLDEVREAMSEAGAGHIGNYSHCTFSTNGIGTFMPLDGTNPHIGNENTLEFVEEVKLESVVTQKKLNKVLESMKNAHPYEEVAYDIFKTDLKADAYSFGKVGELEKELSWNEFLNYLKERLKIDSLRYVGKKDSVKRVAVFSGSFDGDFKALWLSKADVLISGDIKYHTAIDAKQEGLCLVDCGHFATEVVVLDELVRVIEKNFKDVKIIRAKCEEDPFVYDVIK